MVNQNIENLVCFIMDKILEIKNTDNYNGELVKYFNYFKISNCKLLIKGSSQYKHLNYKSDYDLLVLVKKSNQGYRLIY